MMRLRPHHFLELQKIILDASLLDVNEELDASLLDVNEELDIALRDIQQQAAVRNYVTTNKERVGHLIRCLETKKGVNTAR